MELYRYLFAPVLVAVAVWSGHREHRPTRPPDPPAVVAPAVMVSPAPPRPPAAGREASRSGAAQRTASVRPAR